jgi:hypothetical protein
MKRVSIILLIILCATIVLAANFSVNQTRSSIWGGAGGRAGHALSDAGDLDGDNLSEFLIGEPYSSFGGVVRIIYGNVTIGEDEQLFSNVSKTILTFTSGSTLGWDLAHIGDINNDTFADFLVSAPTTFPGGGRVYLFFGSSSFYDGGNIDVVDANASFKGVFGTDSAGNAIDAVGDVNGDGHTDFVIGAPGTNIGGANAGRTFLLFGGSTNWGTDTELTSEANASFDGAVGSRSGAAVSAAGDLNGDGFDDFLIGAWGDGEHGASSGQVFVVFGNATGWGLNTSVSTLPSFYGVVGSDNAGDRVAGIGDANGDGFDDFLVSAPGNQEAGFLYGKVYLIFGHNSTWSTDVSLNNANASYYGTGAGDKIGSSMIGGADLNQDGYDDFLIAEKNGGVSAEGRVYLILGNSTGWTKNVSVSSVATTIFIGEAASDALGGSSSSDSSSLAFLSDRTGDGVADIIMAAGENDEGGATAGQVYFWSGKCAVGCGFVYGNGTDVNQTGVSSLVTTVNGETTWDTFVEGPATIQIRDGGLVLASVLQNLRAGPFNFSTVSVERDASSIVVSMDLPEGQKKTLVLNGDYSTVCVKDEQISSASEISADCSGGNETLFTRDTCPGTLNGITCTRSIANWQFSNLTHSGATGTPPPVPEFSTIALFAILGLVMGGFVVMRRKY